MTTFHFWRCTRCEKVRLPEETWTDVEIAATHYGDGWSDDVIETRRLCQACVRELSDEANSRGGLDTTRVVPE